MADAQRQQDDRGTGPSGSRPDSADGGGRLGRTIALIVILSVFWLILSGRIGLQYFIFMVASIAIVLATNPERPFRPRDTARAPGIPGRLSATVHLFRYLGWLIWNVLKANLEVAAMILHPRMPIRPQLMVFRTEMKSDEAQVLVANSMTLTPGTITVDLKNNHYLVHAIHPASAGAVTGGGLQNKVAPIFGEEAEPAPEVTWYLSYKDIPSEGGMA
jgi:multicomponent Na+:H+ antiporter subunit E